MRGELVNEQIENAADPQAGWAASFFIIHAYASRGMIRGLLTLVAATVISNNMARWQITNISSYKKYPSRYCQPEMGLIVIQARHRSETLLHGRRLWVEN